MGAGPCTTPAAAGRGAARGCALWTLQQCPAATSARVGARALPQGLTDGPCCARAGVPSCCSATRRCSAAHLNLPEWAATTARCPSWRMPTSASACTPQGPAPRVAQVRRLWPAPHPESPVQAWEHGASLAASSCCTLQGGAHGSRNSSLIALLREAVEGGSRGVFV